jgi:hypothetical protein
MKFLVAECMILIPIWTTSSSLVVSLVVRAFHFLSNVLEYDKIRANVTYLCFYSYVVAFDAVPRIMTFLQRAFSPEPISGFVDDVVGQPAWTPEQAKQLFQMIIDAPDNCAPYWKAHEKFGFNAVASLIRHGFVMYRPQFRISKDLQVLREEDAICMRRPVELFALKRLMAKLQAAGGSETGKENQPASRPQNEKE